MKKLIVFVFAVALLGSCDQGSQNKDTSEVLETQLPDSLITRDYIKNNYTFYGAWKQTYPEHSIFEFENYYIYYNGNDGRIIHEFKYKDNDSIQFGANISKWVKQGDSFREIFKDVEDKNGFRIEDNKYLIWDIYPEEEDWTKEEIEESESYDKKYYIKIL